MEGEGYFRRMADALPIPVLVWRRHEADPEPVLVYANHESVKNAREAGHSLTFPSPASSVPGDLHETVIAAIEQGGKSTRELEWEGRFWKVETYGVSPGVAMEVFQDVTSEVQKVKRLEKALRREIVLVDELKQFAYVASHDLKGPLRGVESCLDIIDSTLRTQFGDDFEGLHEDVPDFLREASKEARRGSRLVSDLLKFAVTGNEVEEQHFSMGWLVERFRDDLGHRLEEAQATVTTSGPLPEVCADPGLVIRLLENLLSNSLKFRDSKRKPIIEISAHCLDDGFVEIVFRDNGIGIEPRYLSGIFKVFDRLYSEDEYPGTGIGLALSQKIARAHGGQIWATSEGPGKGTAIHFTLPGLDECRTQ